MAFRGPLLKPSERRKASASASLAPQKRASVSPPTSKARYEFLKAKIHKWVEEWTEVAAALKEIHDDELYKKEYLTFEKFCDGEFGIGQAYAYRLLEALSVKESVAASPMGELLTNERQARALSAVKDTKRVAVLNRVAKAGPVSARAITESIKPQERKAPPKVIDVQPEKQIPLVAPSADDWATKQGRAIASDLAKIETDCLCETYVCDHWKIEAGKRIAVVLRSANGRSTER